MPRLVFELLLPPWSPLVSLFWGPESWVRALAHIPILGSLGSQPRVGIGRGRTERSGLCLPGLRGLALLLELPVKAGIFLELTLFLCFTMSLSGGFYLGKWPPGVPQWAVGLPL